jgi:hypothetical protein
MRRKLILLLVMLVVMSVALAIPADAKKPLGGEMDLYFNLGSENEDAPCPGISWAGTVVLEGTTYGIAFMPFGGKIVGQARHFAEVWEIYYTPLAFEGGVLTECMQAETDIVLSGTDAGVTSPNSKYRMNGTVGEAFAPFAQWDGRNVHMSRDITWQNLGTDDEPIIAPETGDGYFRIN